jgi:hypothetical protein
MAAIIAQARFESKTGLPEDVCINTWHFAGADNLVTMSGKAVDQLTDFYTGGHTGGSPLMQYMSESLEEDGLSITVYDFAAAIPRSPLGTVDVPIEFLAETPLPREVACVLSYRAEYVSGEPKARYRGRVFFGPLNTEGIATDATTKIPTVSSSLRTSLCAAARDLVDAGDSDTAWALYSPSDDAFRVVTQGFVDNEWDTVRSRGSAATVRQAWSGTP